MTKILDALDTIIFAVLSYRPADKGQAATKIERRAKEAEALEKKGSQNDRESSI